MIMQWIIWLLVSVSATNIITCEYIFAWLHEWVERVFPYNTYLITLINCPTCMGFWVGFAASFVFPSVSWWAAPFVCSLACKVFTIWSNKTDY